MNRSDEHTPGPWVVIDEREKRYITDSSDDAIAQVYRDVGTSYFEANCLLVAAAPELLAALQGFVNHGTCFDEQDMTAARAANAKATGVAA